MSSIAVIIVLIAVVLTAVISVFATIAYRKSVSEAKVGSAEEKAREILDDALKTAEAKKREALLEAKEESLKAKNDFEKESRERRMELQRYEKRVLNKEETLDRKSDALEKKEQSLAHKESSLEKQKVKVEELHEKRLQELERISGLTSEQAKDYLLKTVEDDVKREMAVMVKEMKTRAKEEASKKAKEYVVTAIQKCAADHVAETTISLVQLPNDEMKGRIIGREGRNIRTFEALTGIDVIIDDTPEAVVLSGFDPIRREIARMTLEQLVQDGRIHPARIEELVEKNRKALDHKMREYGEQAAFEVGAHNLHPDLMKIMGRLQFRTSYGQNVLRHSIEVAKLSGIIAEHSGNDQHNKYCCHDRKHHDQPVQKQSPFHTDPPVFGMFLYVFYLSSKHIQKPPPLPVFRTITG